MRNKTTRYLSLILGLLVAVSIVFAHFADLVKKDKAATEQTAGGEEEPSEEGKTVITVTSLPSQSVINFSHQVFCLFEIIFAQTRTSETEIVPDLQTNKFFSTLLSVIISPNAP